MTSFFSVDVETDGLGPGVHGLLSIGIVHLVLDTTYTPAKLRHVAEFSINLERDAAYKVLPSTMAFWDNFPEAYAETRKQPLHSHMAAAMALDTWLNAQCPNVRERIFVADPASFDFGMISHLAHKHLGRDLFHYKSIDLSSLRKGLNISRTWLEEFTENMGEMKHTALGDARVQGREFAILWEHGIKTYGDVWGAEW